MSGGDYRKIIELVHRMFVVMLRDDHLGTRPRVNRSLCIQMLEINMVNYVLEILEAKFKLTDRNWRDEILSLVTSRVTKASWDATINFPLSMVNI